MSPDITNSDDEDYGYVTHPIASSAKCTHETAIFPTMEKKPDWSTQSARLKWARTTAGFGSARSAASARGWVIETYKTHENGTRLKKGLSEEDAKRYARAFRVDLRWLMTGLGAPRRSIQEANKDGHAMIAGRIGAGAIVLAEDGDIAYPVDGIPQEIVDTCELYEVLGDSMLPLFHDGDVLAIEKRHSEPRHLLGRLALVQIETGERMIKQINRGSEPGLYTLLSLNASPITDVEIAFVGRLAWARFA